jgi:ATP-binding cassette, subfamily C (CFTR/MRP), member 1
VAYTVQARLGYSEPLTTAKAYTSLALILMLSQPSSMVLQAISAVFSISGNIKRLEEYLERAKFQDPRQLGDSSLEKCDRSSEMITFDHIILDVPYDSEQTPIDLKIMKCTSTMIYGSVESGKSTLLRVILGEVAAKSGKVTNHASSVGYCATPWLRNVTIKENIVNDKEWNDQWYQKVIYTCDLAIDLALLPRGGDTRVGSRGVTLSGGQKHRIALARVLYSRCPLLLLDESFGALDRQTRENVVDRVLKHVRQHRLTLIFVSHDGQ